MHHHILSVASPMRDDRPVRPPPADWDIPFGNLSGTLLVKGEFLNALLPHARPVIGAINRQFPLSTQVPVSPTTKAENLYSRVASAVDRGCLYLYGYDPAAPILSWLRNNGQSGKRLASICEKYVPPKKGVLQYRATLGWFYLLGMLEPIRRRFRTFNDIDLTTLSKKPDSSAIVTWLEELVADDVAVEIAELLRAVRAARVHGRFSANPVFGGTGAVTGSDGDWIAGDFLVELKCVVQVKREHIAQLLCYYAFDRLMAHGHRSHGFGNLALCLPRQRCSLVGTAEEWLSACGGPSVADLPGMVEQWCEPAWMRDKG